MSDGGFIMENYENSYDDLRIYPDESWGLTHIKGLLGAVVGAVPGFLVWLLLARLGYVSTCCGLFIAVGSALGYSFMTKKGNPSPVIGFIVCTAILAVSILLAVKIDWAWEFAKFFEETVYPDFRQSMMNVGISSDEIKELYGKSLMEEFDFTEANFGNCFRNLKVLVEFYDKKMEYIFDYILSGVCGLAGVVVTYTKFIKK